MRTSRKFAALMAIAMGLLLGTLGQTRANTVVFNFDSGSITTPGATAGAGYSSSFDYSQPSSNPSSGTLTATFYSGSTSAFSVVGPTGPTGMSGNYLMQTTSGGGQLVDIFFNSPLNYVSLNYFVTAAGGPSSGVGVRRNQVTLTTLYQGNPNPSTSSPLGSPNSSISGSISSGSTSSTTYFDEIQIATNGTSVYTSQLSLDNITVNAVPEIDPASASGALALLGCGVVMLRGRFRKRSGD